MLHLQDNVHAVDHRSDFRMTERAVERERESYDRFIEEQRFND